MKLNRVILENFGVYARQKFEFDGAPLVLVYGPNESGKTTALNGLRNAMFGFPTRTLYLTGKPMSAEVVGTLADGSELQFTRKKARKDELTGKLGARRVTAEDIFEMLGKMDLESYQQLFGFSLEELREGEHALKSAKLNEALAGGGMGGASVLQHLRNELIESTSTLYKSRGSSRIGNLLNEIRTSQEELRQIQTLPSAVDQIRLQLQQATEKRDEAKVRFAELHQQLSRLERMQQALPKVLELQRIDENLHASEVPEGVDATFVAQWSDYAQQLSMLTQTIRDESDRLSREQAALSGLSRSESTPSNEASIEALGHQAVEIPKMRKRLEELQRQVSEANVGRLRALETLGLNEASEALLQLSISAPQRSELEGNAARFEKISKELVSVSAKLETTAEQLNQIKDKAEEIQIPDNLPVLLELIGKIADEEMIQEQLVESVCDKCESPDFEVLGARLRSRLADCPTLDYSWPIPSSQDVARFLRMLDESHRNITAAQRDVHRLEQAIATSQLELQELESECEQSTWGELKSIARQRDQTINGWLDELMEPLLACSISVEQQKLRLQQLKLICERSDHLLQQVSETAETLAKVSQVKKQIQQLRFELDNAKSSMASELATKSVLDQQWNEAWQHCPFQPLVPELMAGWVSDFESWSRVAAELDIERRKLVTSRAKLKQWRSELADAWPSIIDIEAALAGLKSQLDKWAQMAHISQSESSRVAAAQAIFTDLEARQADLQAQQKSLLSNYQAWLEKHQLPTGWPLTQVTLLVDSVDRLKRETRAAHNYEEQLRELRERIKDFESTVAELNRGGGTAEGLAPELVAQRWLKSLQDARKDASERSKLIASIEHRTTRVREMSERVKDIEGRLAVLSSSIDSASGDLDRTAFDSLMVRAQQAADMRIQRSEISSVLETMAGREPLDEFVQSLSQWDASDLHVQITELKRELTLLEAARQQVDQDFGALNNQLEQLAKSEEAQRKQQHLHTLRGQLTDMSEQWVVNRLAQELLARCIDRFSRDNEPALLQLTHRMLSKLTGGKYTTVEYDANAAGTFLVRSSRGEALEPSRLSTGTREQLYLAIRMAYISHYVEHHEPLPVLMDDCFVNFDDARTRNAVQTLLDWNASVQTILLSCHGRVVQLLAELAPETPVICLDRNATLTAREMVSELVTT